MCGIAGIYSSQSKESFGAEQKVHAMLEAIHHRGPDSFGVWTDQSLTLGHKRLSILDLSDAGAQPMKYKERYTITYNGEVYNFLKIRESLERKGYAFKSDCDTEVLLACIEEYGFANTLPMLKGMFSIACWDSKEKKISLAVDRAGEKPLYYGFYKGSFFFASELKAIKRVATELEIDEASLAQYFRHNYIAAPNTIYKNFKKMEPGTFLELDLNCLETGRFNAAKAYWNLNLNPTEFEGTYEEAQQKLDQLLNESVQSQMVSDVNLGSFLSGGVDSSIVTAVMQKHSEEPIQTFSIGFDEQGLNEAEHAKTVAKYLGTDHTEKYVSGKDCLDWVEKLPNIFCEPFSDSSQIPTLMVSEIAKQKVTVCLTGDGADELFGGYSRYKIALDNFSKIQKLNGKYSGKLIKEMVNLLPHKLFNGLYEGLREPLKLPKVKDPKNKILDVLKVANLDFVDFYKSLVSHSKNPLELVKANCEPKGLFSNKDKFANLSHLKTMLFLDFKTYLPGDILTKVDRAGMHSSLEARVPFLDHDIIEFAFSLPDHYKLSSCGGKKLLRELLYKYVPQNLVDRPKTGFGVPLKKWIDEDLNELVHDFLSKESIVKGGLLNYKSIDCILKRHYNGEVRNEYLIWDLLVFQMWQRGQQSTT